MKKITLSLLAMFMVVTSAFAQISEGEPNFSSIPRTGNRPVEGNCGLYLGASVTQIMDLVNYNDDDYVFWALPAINFKYYFTDNWEGRISFEFACQNEKQKVTYEDNFSSTSSSYNFTRFLPGFAYHFNTKNILDVYVGAQVPIGFDITNDKLAYKNYSEITKNSAFLIGGGVFMGLQVFVADLPFAIGLEVGYSGHVRVGGNNLTTINNDEGKYLYLDKVSEISAISSHKARWGADAALTFSYYFHR